VLAPQAHRRGRKGRQPGLVSKGRSHRVPREARAGRAEGRRSAALCDRRFGRRGGAQERLRAGCRRLQVDAGRPAHRVRLVGLAGREGEPRAGEAAQGIRRAKGKRLRHFRRALSPLGSQPAHGARSAPAHARFCERARHGPLRGH
jgi:hypothetical protein